MSFGDQLRARLSGEHDAKRDAALKDVDAWMDGEVAQRLEGALESAVAEGRDTVTFRHPFKDGFRLEVVEIETLPSFQFLKTRCEHLGLEYLAMSHKALGDRQPPNYPCLEIRVSIPPAYRFAK
jgi:hypothetical protein